MILIQTSNFVRKSSRGLAVHLSRSMVQWLKEQGRSLMTVCRSSSLSNMNWNLSLDRAIPRTRSYTLQCFGISVIILEIDWQSGLRRRPSRLMEFFSKTLKRGSAERLIGSSSSIVIEFMASWREPAMENALVEVPENLRRRGLILLGRRSISID